MCDTKTGRVLRLGQVINRVALRAKSGARDVRAGRSPEYAQWQAKVTDKKSEERDRKTVKPIE
ncbi:hypothetical protein [Paraglaciecola sp. T6c]|uniref:hypothetical protein n=1 Tax=Pseudoalteromonas atlantica (strain T6c / ATCC BAA-1087) TaxID=3042615 RepID=UPI0005A11796|nr:hypothetical protein [Paraglaciecola sp. T6c]